MNIQCEYYFQDYIVTNVVYHVAPITELDEILKEGLRVNNSLSSRYISFNRYFDRLRPENIPKWVSRENAIYASMNFKSYNNWHSHSVILSFKIEKERCWIGNENLANILYEPFILSKTGLFKSADEFISSRGEEFVLNYWNNSLSFDSNLKLRMDKVSYYDAEVLVMHDISPRDIDIVSIISDHKIMDTEGWNNEFKALRSSQIQDSSYRAFH